MFHVDLVHRCRKVLGGREAGQVAVEYVYLALGVTLAVVLIGFAVEADGLKDFGNALSERLLLVTTILKLPI